MAKAVNKKNQEVPVNEKNEQPVIHPEASVDQPEKINDVADEEKPVVESESPSVQPIAETIPDEAFKYQVVMAEVKLNSEPVIEEELPIETKILNFVNSRDAEEIKMNDFLKSLFGVTVGNQPAPYLNQSANRFLRATLSKMVENGDIFIVGNTHLELGNFYYQGNDPETKYHNLLTTSIVAKKVNKN